MDLFLDMTLPAFAASMATCFTTPLEVTKTRLQLDNERATRGTPRKYTGWLDCISKTASTEGMGGLQRGLGLGIMREFCVNALRLGLLDHALDAIRKARNTQSEPSTMAERMSAGFATSTLGGILCNPIEVLKVRMQSQGGQTGYQHGYASSVAAVISLARSEGWAGCSQGLATNTLRALIGPGTQIVTYMELKRAANVRGIDETATSTHALCAAGSAAISIAAGNPVDVVRTRLYNQPSGAVYYSGGVDAARQLLRCEGPTAFYKGAVTHYFRLGPHIVLVFVFMEQLKMLRARLEQS